MQRLLLSAAGNNGVLMGIAAVRTLVDRSAWSVARGRLRTVGAALSSAAAQRVMEVKRGGRFNVSRSDRGTRRGTGTGRNLALLKAAGARSAIGVDLSPAMLSHAAASATRVRADARYLPFSRARFDLVVSSLMCGDVPEPAPWLSEAARVLVRGCHLIYSDFHPSWASSGWRRTFTGADGLLYQLPYFAHPIEQHVDLLNACGFEVRTIREPKLADRTAPIVVVLHAVKRNGG